MASELASFLLMVYLYARVITQTELSFLLAAITYAVLYVAAVLITSLVPHKYTKDVLGDYSARLERFVLRRPIAESNCSSASGPALMPPGTVNMRITPASIHTPNMT